MSVFTIFDSGIVLMTAPFMKNLDLEGAGFFRAPTKPIAGAPFWC
ncbi:hypothetical protein PV387_24940 [Streptomyces sp. ME02-6987-2C]|nr:MULTISPECIES: hypothetical protein [unclassified Streptomyces]MDX3369234.1 hypothetical protein [Streptomyces sp. ME02-6987-2C]MDX3427114.1 hypothetical protein [Streptomyces sp. ME02-6985-2c]